MLERFNNRLSDSLTMEELDDLSYAMYSNLLRNTSMPVLDAKRIAVRVFGATVPQMRSRIAVSRSYERRIRTYNRQFQEGGRGGSGVSRRIAKACAIADEAIYNASHD